uniref:Uncharacterized protein n=1 Tax=viral metagenome TaxID=1070528 RepID=A0A6C0HVH5_9ZZZZ
MNNIIQLIENNNLSIDDYNIIINVCNNKIYNIQNQELNNIFLKNIKNIKIINEELISFFNLIEKTLKINIDNNLNSIILSFDYNEYAIDLCIYSDEEEFVLLDEKIHILNKKTYSYEVYYENCDKKLLKILDFKNVNCDELNNFIKSLFECIPLN